MHIFWQNDMFMKILLSLTHKYTFKIEENFYIDLYFMQ